MDTDLRIPVTADQKKRIQNAARTHPDGLAAWARELLLEGAGIGVMPLYLAKHGKVEVKLPAVDALNDWKKWLENFRSSYRATLYVSPGEVSKWLRIQEDTREIQVRRTRQGADIRRIYIYDDKDELDELSAAIKKDQEANVRVATILKRNLDQKNDVKESYTRLKTYDIALIAEFWVRCLELDESRRVERVRVSNDPDVVDAARSFLEACDTLVDGHKPRRR